VGLHLPQSLVCKCYELGSWWSFEDRAEIHVQVCMCKGMGSRFVGFVRILHGSWMLSCQTVDSFCLV
jgi:hypothetical protein